MTDKELMQQALDALEGYARNCRCEGGGAPCDAAEALRARLAQPERKATQKPVAWITTWNEYCDAGVQLDWAKKKKGRSSKHTPLYTAPPQREWQGLTEDDALQLLPVMPYEYEVDVEMILEFASAIEAKLKEKNG
jgi:hypothetical protein